MNLSFKTFRRRHWKASTSVLETICLAVRYYYCFSSFFSHFWCNVLVCSLFICRAHRCFFLLLSHAFSLNCFFVTFVLGCLFLL
uniref:Uncharacterized protein n=1 Tax=Rhipicephalus appendiculatus TaxID=34631 RepID=A0A131YCD8_RHIAP